MARNCPYLSRSRSRARVPQPQFLRTLRPRDPDWDSAREVWQDKPRDSTEEEKKWAEHLQTSQFLKQLPTEPTVNNPAHWLEKFCVLTGREHRVRAPPTGQSTSAALEEEDESEHLDYSDTQEEEWNMQSCVLVRQGE